MILAYLMFLKFNKYEVTIKVRGYTDGRNQQNWISKEDTPSSSISTEGLIIS